MNTLYYYCYVSGLVLLGFAGGLNFSTI